MNDLSSKVWYAVELDENDNDWGTGSYDYCEALEIARKQGAKYIALIGRDVCVGIMKVTYQEA